MYLLEQFHMIQFYLFSAETLHFGKSSAIVAPNGSGKSAVLDAMQIVLHGGDQHGIDLNAQSGGAKGGRSIREYCLGFYSDDENVRDHATTFLTMIFRDSTGKHPVLSAGIALGASVNEPKHRVYGMYILPGVELTLDNHHESGEAGKPIPLDWTSFKEIAKDLTSAVGTKAVFPEEKRASEFVENLLFHLRPENARGVDHGAFSKALKNALNLKDVTDASAFVRERIIESRPIQIKDFRNQLDSFRLLKNKIAEVIERIGTTVTTLTACKKAISTRMRSATYAAMAAEFRRDMHMEELDQAGSKAKSAISALEEAKRRVSKTNDEFDRVDTQLKDLVSRSKNDPDFNRTSDLQAERDGILTPLKRNLASDLRRVVAAFQKGADRDAGIGSWKYLAKPWGALLDLIAARGATESLKLDPDTEVGRLQETLSNALQLVDSTKQRADEDDRRHIDAQRAFKNAAESLERAKAGKSQLPDSVKHVRRFLEEAGIEATPVCDLVKITDVQWAPAMEAYLRSNVTALLVEPGREDEAIKVYESIPDSYQPFGVKIVKPGRAQVDMSSLPSNALARLIEGDNPHAATFLRARLRRLVQLEAANSRGKDGLTEKGTLVNNDTIERLWLPLASEVLLGSHDRRAQADFLAREKQRFADELVVAERTARRSKELLESVTALTTLKDTLENIDRWLQEHASQERLLDEKGILAQLKENPDLIALQQLVASTETVHRVAKLSRDDAIKAVGSAETEAKTASERYGGMSVRADVLAAEASKAMREPYVDAGWLDERRTALENSGKTLETLIKHCQEAVTREAGHYGTQQSEVRSSVVNYANHYQFELTADPSNLDAVRVGLENELTRLKDSELAGYEQQADDAYITAVRTFRSRIAANLHSSFGDMENQLRDLNSILGRLPPFTNDERYHFKWSVSPEHKPLYDFIKLVAERNGEESLFNDPVNTPAEFRELLEDTSGSSQALLEDYRRFFTYEVEVRRGGMKISTLKTRMEKGSGGEHRAPLFVIAGAALAAAYGKMQGDTSGLSLILFDELGDKIDSNNTRAVFEYLISLGLQPVVAAPDDALGKINESVDGYVELYRDGDYLSIQHVGLGPDAQELLSSDNYFKHPELLEAEVGRVTEGLGVAV